MVGFQGHTGSQSGQDLPVGTTLAEAQAQALVKAHAPNYPNYSRGGLCRVPGLPRGPAGHGQGRGPQQSRERGQNARPMSLEGTAEREPGRPLIQKPGPSKEDRLGLRTVSILPIDLKNQQAENCFPLPRAHPVTALFANK